MRLCWVVEGETEYRCVGAMAGQLGHNTIGVTHIHGGCDDWDQTVRAKVIPQARIHARKNPDKLLIVLDREDRVDCPPALAARALGLINAALAGDGRLCPVSVIVSNKQFECILFADFDLVDRLQIFREPISPYLAGTTDGKKMKSVVKRCLKPRTKYDQVTVGQAIARRMNLRSVEVQARSRSLRKFVKELT